MVLFATKGLDYKLKLQYNLRIKGGDSYGLARNGTGKSGNVFHPVDQNKKTAAKDALATGNIIGGVYGGGTQARKQEDANVQAKTQNVANTNTDFQDTKTGNVQTAVNQATPVNVPQVSAEGYNANQYKTTGTATVTANPNTTDSKGKGLDSSKVNYTTRGLNEGAAAQGPPTTLQANSNNSITRLTVKTP